jgi:hypothetical protein
MRVDELLETQGRLVLELDESMKKCDLESTKYKNLERICAQQEKEKGNLEKMRDSLLRTIEVGKKEKTESEAKLKNELAMANGQIRTLTNELGRGRNFWGNRDAQIRKSFNQVILNICQNTCQACLAAVNEITGKFDKENQQSNVDGMYLSPVRTPPPLLVNRAFDHTSSEPNKILQNGRMDEATKATAVVGEQGSVSKEGPQVVLKGLTGPCVSNVGKTAMNSPSLDVKEVLRRAEARRTGTVLETKTAAASYAPGFSPGEQTSLPTGPPHKRAHL